jgi:hypothetical protein
LLQGLTWRFFEPLNGGVLLPQRQQVCQGGVTEFDRFVHGILLVLPCQCLVKYETASTGKAAHIASLFAIGL